MLWLPWIHLRQVSSLCCFIRSFIITSFIITCIIAPTGMPRGLFINDQINSLYLHWLPPATDKQHGMIIDYNISCVIVEDGSDPYDTTLHDTSNAWSLLISQLGYHPNNDKSINVAMPMFTPFRLISCRVAGINKNGQGPYKYHLATITPPGNTGIQ